MTLVAYLRSRYGLCHIRLESDTEDDKPVEERIKDVLQQVEAVPNGSSGLPGRSVDYYTVGREGFRVSIPEYPGIEGIEVWGSRRIIGKSTGSGRNNQVKREMIVSLNLQRGDCNETH